MPQVKPEQALKDRRALLSFLLKDSERRGRNVLLPVGCNTLDDWLLDSLNVDRLLKQISLGGNIDLVGASVPTGFNSSSTPPRPCTDAGYVVEEKRDALEQVKLPQLSMKSLQLGLLDDQLGELAYSVFIAACQGCQISPNLLQSLRSQLSLTEGRATEILRTVSFAAELNILSMSSLEAQVRLLHMVRPSSFDTFRNFVRWRSTVASTIWIVLSHAARDLWDGSTENSSARSLLARLKGALRRLDVVEPDEFDETEYCQATEGVLNAASEISQHCTSGWSFPPALNVKLAEILLRGIFDSLDEGNFSESADELLKLLQEHVWRELKISPATHTALLTWCHIRQHALSHEGQFLEVPKNLVSQMSLEGKLEQEGFAPAIMGCVSSELRALLSDYRREMTDPRHMKAALALLVASETAQGKESTLADTLKACINSSLESAFNKKAKEVEAKVPMEEDRIALLAVGTGELLKSEFNEYSPLSLPHLATARMVAAHALHELFGARMLPWLVGVNGLNQSVLAAIRASIALEDTLTFECKEDPPQPWDTVQRLSPLVYSWAQSQTSMLVEWIDRILRTEDWSRVSSARAGGARSVVETVKICHETLEALFEMKIPLPPGVVRCLVEGVDSAIQTYCDFISKDVGSAEVLIPPQPPLTRYKRELAAEAEASEIRAAMEAEGMHIQEGSTKLKTMRKRLDAALSTNWLPPLGTGPEEMRVLSMSYESLVVRANSLQHLVDCLPALEHIVLNKWDDGRTKMSKLQESEGTYEWVQGMFNGSKKAADSAERAVCLFIATKVVYGELRDMIFEQLYRFHVSTSRLESVLQEADRHLGDLCSKSHDALPPKLAFAVATALVAAVQQVVLDGGPFRLFTPQDVDLLESDLAQLRATFHCGGEGLSIMEIDGVCRPLSDLIDVMQLDTSIVIENLKSSGSHDNGKARRRLSGGGGGGGGVAGKHPPSGALAMNPDILLRVLCHRADHAASKYLKKEHKIPKKLPSVVSASLHNIGNAVVSKTTPDRNKK